MIFNTLDETNPTSLYSVPAVLCGLCDQCGYCTDVVTAHAAQFVCRAAEPRPATDV